jgi:large subunit ribosomal protein L29
MALPKYSELERLTNISEIDQELFISQKNLFDLKMKRATNQTIKSHLFKHIKRRIAQLNLKRASLLTLNN